jgi:hypothetical protein
MKSIPTKATLGVAAALLASMGLHVGGAQAATITQGYAEDGGIAAVKRLYGLTDVGVLCRWQFHPRWEYAHWRRHERWLCDWNALNPATGNMDIFEGDLLLVAWSTPVWRSDDGRHWRFTYEVVHGKREAQP